MPIKNWFAKKREQQVSILNADGSLPEANDPNLDSLSKTCYSCSQRVLLHQLKDNLMVCSHCGYHMRIGAWDRIHQLCDQFEEIDALLTPSDPLEFTDTEPYVDRVIQAADKTTLKEAVITGMATTEGVTYALAVMDFAYMGGSMGSVVGEKITRLAELALEQKKSLVLICSSGGARMQEGTFSLMQMVKTSAALGRLHEAGLLCVTILTEPTFGGVTASYGTLGDIIIAEEGARIGFAGRRVIEQTIRQKLPADFQTANYLLDYGQVDMVLKRKDIRANLKRLIELHEKSRAQAKNPVAMV